MIPVTGTGMLFQSAKGVADMDTWPRDDPLCAVGPVDGRYAAATAPLVDSLSEAALIRARVTVEVRYLQTLATETDLPIPLDAADLAALDAVITDFDLAAARRVVTIEREGTETHPATNHDVKAVEYFLREQTPAEAHPWIHFGLTSADVNNLARRCCVRAAIQEAILPAIARIQRRLTTLAAESSSTPMPAHTHGQPATPTTFGKEVAVYASRLARAADRLETSVDTLAGKLGGATGTYAAHVVAAPAVDWPAVARALVEELGFAHLPLTTQINPGDDLARLLDASAAVDGVLVDLAQDMWAYTSRGYLQQAVTPGETGSSTMPHKVNPIDFENAEGNLELAMALARELSRSVVRSRMQRDLSDSTAKRALGEVFGHMLIGIERTHRGLHGVAPDPAAMRAAVESTPEVLAEAVQSVLRAAGHADAYERVRSATRGEHVERDALLALLDDADVDPVTADRVRALTPAAYTGMAATLVETYLSADR
jgi:adenylosuccinate lyase